MFLDKLCKGQQKVLEQGCFEHKESERVFLGEVYLRNYNFHVDEYKKKRLKSGNTVRR